LYNSIVSTHFILDILYTCTQGVQEIESIGTNIDHVNGSGILGTPVTLLLYRVIMFLVTSAVLYVQITTRSTRAFRYFTVWNWVAIIIFFFLASISSISARVFKRRTAILDKIVASLFHVILPMTLFIDIITWTILVPMLMAQSDPERVAHWRNVMFSTISYMQHGGNAIIMFGEFLLNRIPHSDNWSHGVVSLWNILFGLWSLFFFWMTGQAIYPFLDAKKPSISLALVGLFVSGLLCSYLIQWLLRLKHKHLCTSERKQL
jgi:hypothetical protein